MTSTPRALLVVALQDLDAGARLWTERIADLRQVAPQALHPFLASEEDRAAAKSATLRSLLASLGAPMEAMPNLWLAAVLDDAARDAETIAQGPLRAIALTGAFRKGKQAERVSYETALGLARRLDLVAAAASLEPIRDAEAQADAGLAELLARLLQEIR